MTKPFLILPVENQVRELDAKLLLGCVMAGRGFRSVVGWKGLIDRHIARFPHAIYFAKSLTNKNVKMLRINRELGNRLIAWDEEAVVHYPPQIQYKRRIGDRAMELIDHLVLWGEDNRELIEGYPHLPPGKPLHVIGNPRADLLRPEFRSFFTPAIDRLRQEYGDFILVNTNFGSINSYHPESNLMYPDPKNPDKMLFGISSQRMPLEYARELFHVRTGIFKAFQDLLPQLCRAFPDRTIVVRPHPAENHDFWRKHLAGCPNVIVTGKGNVLSWLLASACLIHSGCTTAVEGFALGTRIISFMPYEDEIYEGRLPNSLGTPCRDIPAVLDLARHMVVEGAPCHHSEEQTKLINHYICSLEGPLAVDRIADLVERIAGSTAPTLTDRLRRQLIGRTRGEKRSLSKWLKAHMGSKRYDPRFMRQRFPLLDLETIEDKARRLMACYDAGLRFEITRQKQDLFFITPSI